MSYAADHAIERLHRATGQYTAAATAVRLGHHAAGTEAMLAAAVELEDLGAHRLRRALAAAARPLHPRPDLEAAVVLEAVTMHAFITAFGGLTGFRDGVTGLITSPDIQTYRSGSDEPE